MSINGPKETLEASRGQKASEVSVEPSDGKPPFKRKIKTEAETISELKGEDPIKISTEADPDYKDEDEEESEDKADPDDSPDPTLEDEGRE